MDKPKPKKKYRLSATASKEVWPGSGGIAICVSDFNTVWIPKCRKKAIYGELGRYLGEVIRELAARKECKVHEGHLLGDFSPFAAGKITVMVEVGSFSIVIVASCALAIFLMIGKPSP